MTDTASPFPHSPPPSGGCPTLCKHTRNKPNNDRDCPNKPNNDRDCPNKPNNDRDCPSKPNNDKDCPNKPDNDRLPHLFPIVHRLQVVLPHSQRNHTTDKINSEDKQFCLQSIQRQPQHSSSHLQPDIRRNLQHSPHTCKEIIGDIYNTVTVHTLAPVPRHQTTHLQRGIRRHLQHGPHTCKETFGDTYNTVHARATRHHIVQELRESRGGRPELSVLTSLLVSVDVKNY